MKNMNNKKVCFIICTNNELYMKECRKYLNRLIVPEGYEVEVQEVKNAAAMAAGYQQAMEKSDAKYKVYMHQDLFVVNQNLIQDLLETFKDDTIGMIGVVGGCGLPKNGIIYTSWNCGKMDTNNAEVAFQVNGKIKNEEESLEVEAVDGCFFATQYDLPWRTDLFDGWDFYDVSQAFEFRKAGYRVVVPKQGDAWCMHDAGCPKLSSYQKYMEVFLKEYGSLLNGENLMEQIPFDNEVWKITQEVKEQLCMVMREGAYQEALAFLNQNEGTLVRDTELTVIKNILDICVEEQVMGRQKCFVSGEMTWQDMWEKYLKAKFLLYALEYDLYEGEQMMQTEVSKDEISASAWIKMIAHNVIKRKKVVTQMAMIYRNAGDERTYSIYTKMAQNIKNESYEEEQEYETTQEPFSSVTLERIAEIEQICKTRAKILAHEGPEYEKKINQYLSVGDRENLLALIESQEFVSRFSEVTNMAYMILAGQIYRSEMEEDVQDDIFTNLHSIDEVEGYIQQIKFLLWHIEFDTEEDAGIQLLQFMDKHKTSGCLIRYMVHTAGMGKVGLLDKLAAVFLDHNRIGIAFSMLKYADELQPGEEEILCTMADLCLQVGKKEEALLCLDKVKNPTKITEAFRRLCSC